MERPSDSDNCVLPLILPKFIRKKALPYTPLPLPSKIGIERWLRGREECYRLEHADAVIVSYEKSGRTWLRVMLSCYYQRRYNLPEHRLLHYNKMHRLNAAVPVVLFTHDRYLPYYTGSQSSDYLHFADKPAILLARDPRDIAVSLYFHWLHRLTPHNKLLDNMPAHGRELSMYEFVMLPESGLPAIIAFMNRWGLRRSNLPQLAIYRYEDLRADTGKYLEQLLRALGERPSADEVAEIVAYADFDKMKQREQNGEVHDTRLTPGDINNPDSYKVRRAKIGGYRDYFSAQQIETIDSLVDATLDPIFRYHSVPSGS